MKKALVSLAICCWITSCFQTKTVLDNFHHMSYKIVKKDSLSNYFLLYAEREGLKHKIIFSKDSIMDFRNIKLKRRYYLDLISFQTGRSIEGLTELPQNRTLINCYYFDDSTKICYEEGCIRDFYKIGNLKDLNW